MSACNVFDIPEPPSIQELDDKIMVLCATLKTTELYKAKCNSDDLKSRFERKIQAINRSLDMAREDRERAKQQFRETLRSQSFDPERLRDLATNCLQCAKELKEPTTGFRGIITSAQETEDAKATNALIKELEDAARRLGECATFLDQG